MCMWFNANSDDNDNDTQFNNLCVVSSLDRGNTTIYNIL